MLAESGDCAGRSGAFPTGPGAGIGANADIGEWWRPFRNTGGVAVVYVDLTPDPARERAAFALLDSAEQCRWRNYRHPGTRRRFALCRGALRAILGRRLGCRNEELAFGLSEREKPFALVQGSPASISFNVSHSGKHGLIAVASGGRLGIDVEERATRHDLDGPIADVLGPEERLEVAAARGDGKLHLFFLIWTIKEALIKAVGAGHAIDVAGFQAPAEMRRGAPAALFRFPHLPDASWRVENLGNENFAAALAWEMAPVDPDAWPPAGSDSGSKLQLQGPS